MSTAMVAGSGNATGFGLPSPGYWPATRNSIRNPRVRVAKVLASREGRNVSESLEVGVDCGQSFGSHQNVDVDGRAVVAVSHQRHCARDRIRNSELVKPRCDGSQVLVDHAFFPKEPFGFLASKRAGSPVFDLKRFHGISFL